MTPFVIAFIFCWLMAILGILCDAAGRPTSQRMGGWVVAACLLGPLAALVWLLWRPAAPRPDAPDQPPAAAQPLRTQALDEPEPQTTPAHSPIYLLVAEGDGRDAYRSVAIPASGTVVVRRARRHERALPGVLMLHDGAASRNVHCRIRIAGPQVTLEDCSRNGTLVDGLLVYQAVAPLALDSQIRIGQSLLVLRDGRSIAPTRRSTESGNRQQATGNR